MDAHYEDVAMADVDEAAREAYELSQMAERAVAKCKALFLALPAGTAPPSAAEYPYATQALWDFTTPPHHAVELIPDYDAEDFDPDLIIRRLVQAKMPGIGDFWFGSEGTIYADVGETSWQEDGFSVTAEIEDSDGEKGLTVRLRANDGSWEEWTSFGEDPPDLCPAARAALTLYDAKHFNCYYRLAEAA